MTERKAPFARLGALALCVALAACAPLRTRETPASAQAQAAREQTLAAQPNWTLTARIAVSNGQEGGSGELEWSQHGDAYTFTVHAPVTGKTWKLSGDGQSALLEGVDPAPDRDSDPARLLHDRLGWDVPLKELDAWVRGMRAVGSNADVIYDEHNLPAVLQQAGWKVEYRDWFEQRTPPLPRKVFASRGNARVKVAISDWKVDD